MSATQTEPMVRPDSSAAKAWLRALELTASIPRNPDRLMSTVVEELVERHENAPALLSESECFTYRELGDRSNQYSRWALEHGIAKGDVVALLMANRPEYFAIWLGITRVGGVVALLNTNLVGSSLAHSINIVGARHIIVTEGLTRPLSTALSALEVSPTIWIHGADHPRFLRVDHEIQRQPSQPLTNDERPQLTIEDRALYIFTSGTTGLPKAANISHARVLQWSHWFAGMTGMQPTDRTYSCLPMYHSIGGVLVPGAALIGGGSVVVQEKFSASRFWESIVRWDCTMFQYIGEFCRYLLHTPASSDELAHRVRLACGNGLAPDVWENFQTRFKIPQVLEFYASTEGGVSLFNAEGKRGSIGRIPPYLAHRFAPALVRFDVEEAAPVRNAEGFCIPCGPDEPGEALGKVVDDPSNVGSRFEGYTDKNASENKVLRDVFVQGDRWVRTGDLMRKDAKGFFYFVDRIGDTFRWKGENVATSEVSEAICAFPRIKHANVYGVAIPAAEGRAGMAALVVQGDLDLVEFRRHLIERLPPYARPLFLRLQDDVEVTGTFKYSKTDLVRQGYAPSTDSDALYFDNPESQAFVRIDQALYERIQAGQIRL
jgi:fatty-acyl-CoA synthase